MIPFRGDTPGAVAIAQPLGDTKVEYSTGVDIDVLLLLSKINNNTVDLIFDFGIPPGNINSVFGSFPGYGPDDALHPVFSEIAEGPWPSPTIAIEFDFSPFTVEEVIKQGTIILTRVKFAETVVAV